MDNLHFIASTPKNANNYLIIKSSVKLYKLFRHWMVLSLLRQSVLLVVSVYECTYSDGIGRRRQRNSNEERRILSWQNEEGMDRSDGVVLNRMIRNPLNILYYYSQMSVQIIRIIIWRRTSARNAFICRICDDEKWRGRLGLGYKGKADNNDEDRFGPITIHSDR